MRFLADAGISPRTAVFLRAAGHDVVHVRDLRLQRAADREILTFAESDDRIVLTFNLNFGNLLALGVADKPSVILFRLSDQTATSVNGRLQRVLERCATELARGALVLVEDARYRLRRLPIGRVTP